MKFRLSFILLLAVGVLTGCSGKPAPADQKNNFQFPEDNGGITLPDGFSAIIVADSLGPARHITVAEDGDIYVALQDPANGGAVVALRDTDGDAKADIKEYFGEHNGGTGIELHNNYLYVSSDTKVFRYEMSEDSLAPTSEAEVLIEGFPQQNQHASKSLVLDNAGSIYVNIGAPSNSCQEQDRTKGSPGMAPCPLLERHAGIWQFSATALGQTQQEDGTHYAIGIRNTVGLDWNDQTDALYIAQHGRDQLFHSWPEYYTKEEGAELPAEALYKVSKGDNMGWPYSYFNQKTDTIMLAPEYGGDGETPISDSEYSGQFEEPILAFPGHWAPNALLFYSGSQFPEKYQGGAFIAFHGSWNRAPMPQQGYKVIFAPFENGEPTGDYTTFADGFAGSDEPQPGSAKHRPTGLALGPDGSLYITDDTGGTVWRVVYTGNE